MSAANVVRLPPRQRPLVNLVDSPIAIKLVQDEILRSQLFYSAIATRAQVSSSTVSNIASGATRWPRLETIIRILSALGWSIMAKHEREVADE